MKNKYQVPLLAGIALLGGLGAGAVGMANAQTATIAPTTSSATRSTTRSAHTRPTAMGSVTAVSGTTITLTDKMSNTTYTVDASGATITRGPNTTGSISDVTVGSMVAIEGTLSGTNITATAVRVGTFGRGHGGFGGMGMGRGGTVGTVTSISGSTIVLTDRKGGIFTIDAGTAAVTAGGSASTLASVKVGDKIFVQGSVKSATMTATKIEDGLPTPSAGSVTTQ